MVTQRKGGGKCFPSLNGKWICMLQDEWNFMWTWAVVSQHICNKVSTFGYNETLTKVHWQVKCRLHPYRRTGGREGVRWWGRDSDCQGDSGRRALLIFFPKVNIEIGQNCQRTTISVLSKYKKLRQVYLRQVLNFSKISEACGGVVGAPPTTPVLGYSPTQFYSGRGWDEGRQLPAQGSIQQRREMMIQ